MKQFNNERSSHAGRHGRDSVNRDDEGPVTSLAVTVQSGADGVSVIRAVGEVDQLTAPELGEALTGAFQGSAAAVLLDLMGITFMGSAGLAVLVEAAGQAQKVSRQLMLIADSPPVLRPLSLTGLDTVLTVHATEQAALDQLSRSGSGS